MGVKQAQGRWARQCQAALDLSEFALWCACTVAILWGFWLLAQSAGHAVVRLNDVVLTGASWLWGTLEPAIDAPGDLMMLFTVAVLGFFLLIVAAIGFLWVGAWVLIEAAAILGALGGEMLLVGERLGGRMRHGQR